MRRSYHATRMPLEIEIARLKGRRRASKALGSLLALVTAFVTALLLWLFVEQVQTGHAQTISDRTYWEARR